MNPILRNILAVMVGVIVGGMANMGQALAYVPMGYFGGKLAHKR